jgi:hypothetical protein
LYSAQMPVNTAAIARNMTRFSPNLREGIVCRSSEEAIKSDQGRVAHPTPPLGCIARAC